MHNNIGYTYDKLNQFNSVLSFEERSFAKSKTIINALFANRNETLKRQNQKTTAAASGDSRST